MENTVTLKRKTRYDCEDFAPCGKISHARCKKYKGRLDICSGCTLVKRYGNRGGTMVEGILMRRCTVCGRMLPVHRFYQRKVHHPNGKTYYTRASRCDLCISRLRKGIPPEARASPVLR